MCVRVFVLRVAWTAPKRPITGVLTRAVIFINEVRGAPEASQGGLVNSWKW